MAPVVTKDENGRISRRTRPTKSASYISLADKQAGVFSTVYEYLTSLVVLLRTPSSDKPKALLYCGLGLQMGMHTGS